MSPTSTHRPSTGRRLQLCQASNLRALARHQHAPDLPFSIRLINLLTTRKNICSQMQIRVEVAPAISYSYCSCVMTYAAPVFLCIKHLLVVTRLAAVLRTGLMHNRSCSKREVSEACTLICTYQLCLLSLLPPSVCTGVVVCAFQISLAIAADCCIGHTSAGCLGSQCPAQMQYYCCSTPHIVHSSKCKHNQLRSSDCLDDTTAAAQHHTLSTPNLASCLFLLQACLAAVTQHTLPGR